MSNNKSFKRKTTPYGTLIRPKHSKWSWSPEEIPYRSVIVDNDNKIISSGFIKFAGVEEEGFIDNVRKIRAELETNKKILCVEKLDGVLIIRSVINGKVIWRTRGTHDGGLHKNAIAELAPKHLNNPNILPDSSMLFEMLHDEWKIVVEYPERALRLIGVIDHHNSYQWPWHECLQLAEELSLKTPEWYYWTGTWKKLVTHVGKSGGEGIVCQTVDGQTMVKIKTSSYFQAHRIIFTEEKEHIVQLWKKGNWKTIEEAKNWFTKHSISVSVFEDHLKLIGKLINTKEEAEKHVEKLDMFLLKTQMLKQPLNMETILKNQIIQNILEKENISRQQLFEEQDIIALLKDGRYNDAVNKKQKKLIEELEKTITPEI